MSTFIKTIKEYKKLGHILDETKMFAMLENIEDVLIDFELSKPTEFWNMMKELHEDFKGEHFDETYARHAVSEMFHTNPEGRMVKGEKFDLIKAQEVHAKYRSFLKTQDTVCDVYVAINAQYHDYVCLYKNWFNTTDEIMLDIKVIESAIKFWFQNEDRKDCDNIWKYFKHKK